MLVLLTVFPWPYTGSVSKATINVPNTCFPEGRLPAAQLQVSTEPHVIGAVVQSEPRFR